MDRKERVKELLARAWGLGAAERDELLRRECGGDAALRREVEGLLAAGEHSPHLAGQFAFRVGGDDDETLGKILGGRYRIVSPLGKGGMGQVYLAEDTKIPTLRFAVKIFDQGFEKEVEALARVKSDRVVKIVTTGKTDGGRPFMVMEHLTGQTLARLLDDRGRLPKEEVAQLIREISEAATEIHETRTGLDGQGIIHRDLKPSNIMVERRRDRWKVKLFDLGVARLENPLMGRATSTHVAKGTPLYMAPEQFHGKAMANFGCKPQSPARIITPATDIYSLGVIAYEMLVGLNPFRGAANMAGVSAMQREGGYVKALGQKSEIPAAARDAILKAMAFCPEARYQKAEEFGERLAEALTAAPPKPNYARLAVALTLLALLGLGALTWFRPGAAAHADNNRAAANANSTPNVNANSNSDRAASTPDSKNGSAGSGSPGAAQSQAREVSYWLVTQQKINDRLSGEPKVVTADEGLNDGWNVKFYFVGKERGHLYVINDGPVKGGGALLQILFPIPNDPSREQSRNNGTSEITPGRIVEAFDSDLDRIEGTEHLWVVWSAERIPELERLTRYAVKEYRGRISDPGDAEATRAFLARLKQADVSYDERRRAVLRGEESILAKELLLKRA
jgi:serine/threonine protein kinase